MECGKTYDCGSVKLEPVELKHDVENIGYKIYIGEEKAIYMTDTKTVEHIEAKDFDIYFIESNYTEDSLWERIREKQESGDFVYEWRVRNTHLSHEQASAFLLKNMGEHSDYVYLHQHKS